MTIVFRLCGNTADHKNPCPWLSGEWIHALPKQMHTLAATCSGFQIEEELHALSFTAREILNSAVPGRALDLDAQVIDKITLCDELHILSRDIRTVETITRDCLGKNEYLTRFAEDYGNRQDARSKLESYCDTLKNRAEDMETTAASLKSQIKAEIETQANQLTEISDAFPRDCFSVIAQYLVT